MKTTIAYIITILGAQVALITFCIFIISLPFLPIIKKINSNKIWFIFNFVMETIAGVALIWITIFLWKWLDTKPSILIPILLSVPIIIWNWTRIKPQIGTETQWDEVANLLGALTGIIFGSIALL